MDWALITQTLEHLETLSAEDLAQELSRLNAEDKELISAVEQLRGNRENAASFMQTHMPGSQEQDGATLELGSHIGIWQIDCLLGTGGMGEVYRATRADGLFDQQVALKLSHRMGDEFAARFESERQRLAQLEHPNIARIVDGGTSENGSPYMTMEYVDGLPIDIHCQQSRLDREARLALVQRLCAAVAHAHGRLVLHRDIKHANVLINSDGELRLIDFGVASLIGDDDQSAEIGALTLAYAAPEQLRGEQVSAATDIFAIGMLAHLLETRAVPKRQSDGSVAIEEAGIGDADLAAILGKATAQDPLDRYVSVDALGDDLRKFADGFPVAARPVSTFTRFKKLVFRNTLASAMGGVAALAMIAGVIGVSLFAIRANEARVEAEENLLSSDHFAANMMVTADMMQRAFGGAEDQDRLAETITEYQNQKLELKSTDPEQVARINLAAAIHFMRRQDYPRAIAILEPWLEEGYGTPQTLQDGSGVFARSLMDVGRTAEAVPILRELEKTQVNSSAAFTASHAATASQLGYASREADDLDLAEHVLLKTIEAAPGDDYFGYLYNQLAVISRLKGDFGSMQKYMLKSYKIDQAKGLTETVNLDVSVKNLAQVKFYYGRDKVGAQKDLATARQLSERKGESAVLGSIAIVEAAMLRDSGEYADAEAKVDYAIEVFGKFAAENGPYSMSARAEKAELAALQKRAGEARALLNTVSASNFKGQEAEEVQARKKLAQQFVEGENLALGSNIEPLRLTKSEMGMVCTNISLLRRYSNMANDGLLVAHPCVKRLK